MIRSKNFLSTLKTLRKRSSRNYESFNKSFCKKIMCKACLNNCFCLNRKKKQVKKYNRLYLFLIIPLLIILFIYFSKALNKKFNCLIIL